MIGKLFLTLWILPWICIIGDPTEAQQWSGVLDESLDERHDAEIFRAVVESMRLWESHKKSPHRTKREVSRVCYEEVGCFEDTGPFSYLEMLPSHPKDVGTRFFMYGSRKARSAPMEVPADDINDDASNAIDSDLPTKVIVHGFGSGCEHVWVYEMRSALMSVHDCNIVCVDWSQGSAIPNYVRAAANTRLVGRQLAKLVRSLNVPLEKVHLIGFSLGAHVAGFAGAELGNVSRITGLDPAGPLFESQDPRARLDETDATFVDVIHSNGEQLILGGLGSWQPMGDVDFYPNGGRMQTGCSNLFLGAVSDIIWSGSIEGRSLCNHRRAYKLFTDSVSPKCRFPAFPCETGYDGLIKGDCFPCAANSDDNSCGDMGYYSDATNARGQLYLVTREEEPFCAHQYQVKVYNSRGERPVRSYGKLQVALVGDSNFNETFTMTRKDDEELVVGAILQKIVVPHPVISSLEAIEIKYTAYSGWISSGLASWSVDKVSVTDSFGKSLSVCMRGLTLESGRAVYLPLYPGECNVPLDQENSTSSGSNSTKSAAMIMEAPEKIGEPKQVINIGPFTKEQNYERIDVPPIEITTLISETNSHSKGIGPFTKEHNKNPSIHEDAVQLSFVPKDGEENLSSAETKKSSPWSYVDVSEAGSNLLENAEIESGRGFSGTNFVPSSTHETPARPTDPTTMEYHAEVREPVLQMSKKETGRSLRLPEITEPILRPRTSRQNTKNPEEFSELEESSSGNSTEASRAFTVQFLPERLARILAQAERYARQTLLPLISQYTPSFVGNSRDTRVKYFPPLSDQDENHGPVSEENTFIGNTERSNEVDPNERGESSGNSSRTSKEMSVNGHEIDESENVRLSRNLEKMSETIVNKSEQTDWIPIARINENLDGKSARFFLNSSKSANADNYESKWVSEGAVAWNPPVEDVEAGPETKIDDWVPIVERSNKNDSKEVQSTTTERQNSVEIDTTTKFSGKIFTTSPRSPSTGKSPSISIIESADIRVESTSLNTDFGDKKFIPIADFANRDVFPTSGKENDESSSFEDPENPVLNTENPTHIQKIPPAATSNRRENSASGRTMIFPYAYERKKDPRTRYIPLLPADEIHGSDPLSDGMKNPLAERDR